MKILLIIPAYNEALNIERVVDNLIKNYPQYDYIVVNDGSKDETAAICRKNGYNLLDLPVNVGLSGAVQAGMKYAAAGGYDTAAQIDADGQHNPIFIEKMASVMQCNSADIVIGSRFLEKKKERGLRMLGSNIISSLIKATTSKVITDPTSGLRIFDKKMIHEFAYNINYAVEPDTLVYLICSGAKVAEVQVEMNERLAGESYLNLTSAARYMLNMCISIVFIQRFRKRAVK